MSIDWSGRIESAAPPTAQLDADNLPPPEYFGQGADGSDLLGYTKQAVEQIVAPYAERIRMLERNQLPKLDEDDEVSFPNDSGLAVVSAARYYQLREIEECAKQPAQSIDTPEFREVLSSALIPTGASMSTEGLSSVVAFIDGRTAGTALPEGLVEVGKLQINPDDPESETGHSYDIVTNYPGHEKLAAMDGARLFAAPSTQEGAND